MDRVDELEDVSAGHSTASHILDNRSRPLNPQVLGSNPRGRTTKDLVRALYDGVIMLSGYKPGDKLSAARRTF
jgi:hypothetical protein